jgi:hypothetical protein
VFFFFFVGGVVWFEQDCAVVTGKSAGNDFDNDDNDDDNADDDEKECDDDDDCRFDSDDGVSRDFFFAGIFDISFLTFFGGVTIEVDVFGTFDALASDGDRSIVFAMLLILCCVVSFLEK